MHSLERVAYSTFHHLRRLKARVRPHRDEEYARILADPLGTARAYYAENAEYALKHVPFYRQTGLRPEERPILTKPLIREHFEALQSDRLSELTGVVANTSGGSTGVPVRFLQDPEYNRFVGYAMNYFFDVLIGHEWASLRKLMIWGSEKDLFSWSGDWRKKLQGYRRNTKYVNSFSLSEETLAQCAQTINAYRPEMIRGYASSLVEVARYIKRRNLRVRKPLFLVSSAETLTPEAREEIQDVFGAPVFDLYGSRECGAIAGECRAGLMHLFTFNHYVELAGDGGRPVGPGGEGRILVTTLHNRAMPLIRFDIGDIGVAGPETCSCGCPLPVLERIRGRVSDNFVTKDGTVVHGEYFTHLFYFRDWVEQFQVVQEDVAHVVVNLALQPGKDLPTADRAELEQKIRLVMGEDCIIDFQIADEIPKSPQGKHLFTFSKVLHARNTHQES